MYVNPEHIFKQGKYFQVGKPYIYSDHFDGRTVSYERCDGWWERKNGSDGGDLELWLNDDGHWEVSDFDGAYDLPSYLRKELEEQSILVDF